MDKKAFVKYILALLFFGSNGVVASHIALTSYEIIFFRTMIGSIFLVLIFKLTGGKFTIKENKRDFTYVAIAGIAMGISWIFVFEAYREIGVSLTSLLYYCGPVVLMILSPVLFKEKLTAPKVIGFCIVFVGIILVNGKMVVEGGSTWGLICAGLAMATYCVLVISNKKSTHIVGLENATIQLVFAFIAVAVFVGIKQHFIIDVEPSSIPWILIIGTVNSGIGCYLYFSPLSKLPVQTVAICGYVEPLSAVLFATLILGEVMTLPQAIGGVCIIGGAMIGELVKT